jgi:hypothetical protein
VKQCRCRRSSLNCNIVYTIGTIVTHYYGKNEKNRCRGGPEQLPESVFRVDMEEGGSLIPTVVYQDGDGFFPAGHVLGMRILPGCTGDRQIYQGAAPFRLLRDGKSHLHALPAGSAARFRVIRAYFLS